MNVDIFALYIFLRCLCLSNICENMYIMKITFIMPHRGKNIENTNINLREIANFRECAKIRSGLSKHQNLSISFTGRQLSQISQDSPDFNSVSDVLGKHCYVLGNPVKKGMNC